MALVFTEGFDWGNPLWTSAQMQAGFDKMGYSYQNGIWQSFQAGRYGGYSIKCDYGYGIANTISSTGGYQDLYIGFAAKPDDDYTSSNGYFGIGNSVTSGFNYINIHKAGYIRFADTTGTYVSSLAGLFNGSIWNYFELHITASKTVGTATIRINGVEVMSLTNLKTLTSSATDYLDRIFMGGGGTQLDCWYDDIYMCDTTPGGPAGFLGPIRIQTLAPNGVGDVTQFSPSNAAYDNYVLANNQNMDDTTYVYGSNSTSGYYDLYQGQDLVGVNTVYGVKPLVMGRQTDTAPQLSFGSAIKSNGSTVFSSPTTLATSQYNKSNKPYGLNPVTGTAWTLSDVNALQFGPKQG